MTSVQSRLIIGDALEEDFFRINDMLRDSTVRLHAKEAGQEVTQYNPWACAIPIYGKALIDGLLVQADYQRGHLLADEPYLKELRTSLSGMITHDHATHRADDTLPSYALTGPFKAWLPATQVDDQTASIVAEGRDLLMKAWPSSGAQYEALVEYIVPMRASTSPSRRGFCTDYARGVIFREIPADTTAWEMGFDLANGLGHQSLYVWKSVDPLMSSPYDDGILSYRRRKVKPAILFLHEVVALAFTFRYLRGCQINKLVEGEALADLDKRAKEMSSSLRLSLGLLRSKCRFTPIGQALLSDIDAVVAQFA